MKEFNPTIINFMNSEVAEFEMTAEHTSIELVAEAISVKCLVAKKDKLQAVKVAGNIFFLRNGVVLMDQKVTNENGKFQMLELTSRSATQLESIL